MLNHCKISTVKQERAVEQQQEEQRMAMRVKITLMMMTTTTMPLLKPFKLPLLNPSSVQDFQSCKGGYNGDAFRVIWKHMLTLYTLCKPVYSTAKQAKQKKDAASKKQQPKKQSTSDRKGKGKAIQEDDISLEAGDEEAEDDDEQIAVEHDVAQSSALANPRRKHQVFNDDGDEDQQIPSTSAPRLDPALFQQADAALQQAKERALQEEKARRREEEAARAQSGSSSKRGKKRTRASDKTTRVVG